MSCRCPFWERQNSICYPSAARRTAALSRPGKHNVVKSKLVFLTSLPGMLLSGDHIATEVSMTLQLADGLYTCADT